MPMCLVTKKLSNNCTHSPSVSGIENLHAVVFYDVALVRPIKYQELRNTREEWSHVLKIASKRINLCVQLIVLSALKYMTIISCLKQLEEKAGLAAAGVSDVAVVRQL